MIKICEIERKVTRMGLTKAARRVKRNQLWAMIEHLDAYKAFAIVG
jgi:hypothetical protein